MKRYTVCGVNAAEFFQQYYPLLAAGNTPYGWQAALFDRFIAADWPDSLALPTGSGKTAILQIWTLALAWCAIARRNGAVPRRLVWVVNRRVVVDQATDEALAIERALAGLAANNADDPLVCALRQYSGSENVLAVSTLRGERADNREWSRDPSVPAIVVGTVDMIGSRLLFRGYGDGKYWRPYHAGLLGVDALVVNDESHLTPAFARLLVGIRNLSPAAPVGQGFRVMLVSATERGLGEKPFDFPPQANAGERFQRIYEAEKRLTLHEAADRQEAHNKLVELALASATGRTIVFVEQPEKAAEAAARIEKRAGAGRVALLTGTMRGWERDNLAGNPVFHAFQSAAQPDEPLFLVTTSAGEVGVNISGERLLTALVESDRLLQRLGRLNRFGGPTGEAHVVYVQPKDKEVETPAARTLEYLRALPDGDVSCRALDEHPPGEDTRSAEPAVACLEEWLLDLWAQTTAGDSAAPQVDKWLHGRQEDEYPATEIAWREEVEWLARDEVAAESRQRALERHRVLPRERLSEPERRVKEKLRKLAETAPDTRALLVASDQTVRAATVAELAAEEVDLRYGLVLLPPGSGRLSRGMFRAEPGPDGTVYDVADRGPEAEAPRRRYLAASGDGGQWIWRRLAADEEMEGPNPRDRKALASFAAAHGLGTPAMVEVQEDTGEAEAGERLLLFFPGKRREKGRPVAVELAAHCEAVARRAAELGARLLGEEPAASLAEAGRLHDIGKAHELWQRAMGGDAATPLAKTAGGAAPRLLGGFRHELASLLRAQPDHPGDLALHLIASHHGWSRPHWEPQTYDRQELRASEEAALDAARRFGALQERWGRWGLAYLEALLKAADGLESEAAENGHE